MRNLSKFGVVAAIGAAVAVTALPSESRAGVMSVPDTSIISPPSQVEQIHFRRYRHHHHRYWRYGRYYYYPYYNPAAAVVGAAAGLATAPLWGWGYPYYYRPWY